MSFTVAGNTLTAFDRAHKRLWDQGFSAMVVDFSQYLRADRSTYTRGTVEDLNGDGHNEVLFAAHGPSPANWGLYCFNSAGHQLFRTLPDPNVRFGDEQFSPPFKPTYFLVTPDPKLHTVIWLASEHPLDFPSVVYKVDPRTGRALGAYWLAGHVSALAEARLMGRRVILVSAVNNETGGASLSVLDYSAPTGSSPAASVSYRCADCPTAKPLAFLVFPATDVWRAMNRVPALDQIQVDALTGSITVRLSGGTDTGVGPTSWGTYYTLDARLRLVDAWYGSDYRAAHADLETLHLLDHPLRKEEQHDLFRVLSWTGTEFVRISRIEVLPRTERDR